MSDSIHGISVVESGGLELTSNSDTPEQMRASMGVEEDSISKAAAELGKKGGEASAAKRAGAKEAGKAKENTSDAEIKPQADEDNQENSEKPLGKPRDDPRA